MAQGRQDDGISTGELRVAYTPAVALLLTAAIAGLIACRPPWSRMRRLVITVVWLGLHVMMTASAGSIELTVSGDLLSVKTNAYEIRFVGAAITSVTNRLTSEVYTLPNGVEGRTGILRPGGGPAWPGDAGTTTVRNTGPDAATITVVHGENEVRLFINVDPDTGDLVISQIAESAEPVQGVQWGIGRLDAKRVSVILPAQGGQILDWDSSGGTRRLNYPGSWEAQLAILQGARGGLFVRAEDDAFRFKALRYDRDADSIALSFETQNQAPFDKRTSAKSVTWRLNAYEGDWRVPAQVYRDWMDTAFDPRLLSDMPSWVARIGLIVIYGGPLDADVLDRLAARVDPRKTLLYLPHWRRDAYDANYPDYTARPDFGDFVEAAHARGFRIMVHTNLIAVSTDHPAYADLKRYQFRDPINGHRVGDAAINPASSRWRRFFVGTLLDVWEVYQVDAFHLDVSTMVLNDGNGLIEGLNSAQGTAQLHVDLANAMPDVAFGGEMLHEATFARESFAQRWIPPSNVTPHPICAFLFSRSTPPYGYLATPNPDTASQLYHHFLNSQERYGALPTLSLDGPEQLGPDYFAADMLLSFARGWQEHGLAPDFETEWDDETIFRYTAQSGGTAVVRRTDAGSALILPDGRTGYERIHGVTRVETGGSIPHWRAYDETALFGLDPDTPRFLSSAPRDDSQIHVNSLPPGVRVTQTRVTDSAAYFELDRDDSSGIDLLPLFRRGRNGTVIGGAEMALDYGAGFAVEDLTIAGELRHAISAHPPWKAVTGEVFGEFTVSVPDAPNVRLEFDVGLQDGSEQSDGATFIVDARGKHVRELFREHHRDQKWRRAIVDLTPMRGQDARLRFTVGPGPNGDVSSDWAAWGDPRIVVDRAEATIQVAFHVPEAPTKIVPSGLRSPGHRQYLLETRLPASALFLFGPGAEIVPPVDLATIPFVTGLQSNGVFRPGGALGAGSVTVGTCGGIAKPSIFAHPPQSGQTLLQFAVSLPEAPACDFSFSMGLGDGADTDGVTFKVLLDGDERVDHSTKTPGWTDGKLSLSEFAGQSILLELVTDPGASFFGDWAHWGDLRITAAESE